MKIPENIIADVIKEIQNEAEELSHGIITFQLHCRDNLVHHYKVNREKSVVTNQKAEGMSPNSLRGKTNKNRWRNNERGL